MKIMVTGGCGFIGSNFVRYLIEKGYNVINYDSLTYAGNLDNLKDIENNNQYEFVKGDVCDKKLVMKSMKGCDVVVHMAAESHVDRSITGPEIFTMTNVVGTKIMLEAARQLDIKKFIYMSTDEVYGSIEEGLFTENHIFDPTSPYSASKAGADLMVQAYFKTFALPTITIRGSNNFGPYQFPEKLIPLFISNITDGKKVPVYGTGKNVRDWIYVKDTCRALLFLIKNGKVGEAYNVGGGNERTNIFITKTILENFGKDDSMIEYVEDRKGHDLRYALDSTKLFKLGFKQKYDFESALNETINWYENNETWWRKLKNE
jgi:dTDP-glucose 4,6-dehydratase